jgi:hypothetical protein
MVAALSSQHIASRETSPCYAAALYYAEVEGLPVFPLHGKIPFAGTRGFYDASRDPAVIAHWWQRWPHANIGIPTGRRSGWIVLDIDGRHDGVASLKHLLEQARQRAAEEQRPFEPLPPTRAAYTGGGGLHLVFAMRDDLEFPVKNATALGDYSGIDLRGEGGYVVVAPSLHESGQRYAWLNEEPLAPFPDLLAELCRPRPCAPASSTPGDNTPTGRSSGAGSPQFCDPDYCLLVALRKAQVGMRHRYALFLACRLVGDSGLTFAQAEPYMRAYAHSVSGSEHDFTEREAIRCLEWACAHV